MNKTVLLLFSNILTLTLLVVLLVRENYPQKIRRKLSPSSVHQGPLYLNNADYGRQMELYRYYQKKGRIVMLGNSITHRVQWHELLGRDDVINRGIDNDLTAGFLARLEEVTRVEPELCFIMGGVNDLMKDVPTDSILANLAKLTEALQQQQIRPVIQSILYVGEGFPKSAAFNSRIEATNHALEKWCENEKISFLDLNEKMKNPGFLRADYTTDEVHLSGKGYDAWKAALLPLLPITDDLFHRTDEEHKF